MKAQFTFFLNNIITQHLISATKAWFRTCHVTIVNITAGRFLASKDQIQLVTRAVLVLRQSAKTMSTPARDLRRR